MNQPAIFVVAVSSATVLCFTSLATASELTGSAEVSIAIQEDSAAAPSTAPAPAPRRSLFGRLFSEEEPAAQAPVLDSGENGDQAVVSAAVEGEDAAQAVPTPAPAPPAPRKRSFFDSLFGEEPAPAPAAVESAPVEVVEGAESNVVESADEGEPVPVVAAPTQTREPSFFDRLFGNDAPAPAPAPVPSSPEESEVAEAPTPSTPASEPSFFGRLFAPSEPEPKRTEIAAIGQARANASPSASAPKPKKSSSFFGDLFGSSRSSRSSDDDGREELMDQLSRFAQRNQMQMVRTTAYTHTEADHREWGRKTAAGTTLQAHRRYNSAAADWSVFPPGTKFRIVGDPTQYVVDDYGRALVGTETIDIYKPSRSAMNHWGVRNVQIEILELGCFHEAKRILESRLHHAHCKKMYRALLPKTWTFSSNL